MSFTSSKMSSFSALIASNSSRVLPEIEGPLKVPVGWRIRAPVVIKAGDEEICKEVEGDTVAPIEPCSTAQFGLRIVAAECECDREAP